MIFSTGVPRPYVPKDFHDTVFKLLHSLAHPGIQTAQHLLIASSVWLSINTNVRKWTCCSIHCQRSNIQQHTVIPFVTPDARFDYIHINLLGPLPPSNGYSYILTCINRLTCWVEAISIVDVTAETVACAVISGWISHFGIPSTITDHGCQFESTLWKQLMGLLGSARIRTTAYHPITNAVEHFHQQLKTAFKSYPYPNQILSQLFYFVLELPSN